MTANKSPPNYPKLNALAFSNPNLFSIVQSIYVLQLDSYIHCIETGKVTAGDAAETLHQLKTDMSMTHRNSITGEFISRMAPPVKLSELGHFSGPECSNHFPTWNLSRQSVDDDLTRESALSRTTQPPDQVHRR